MKKAGELIPSVFVAADQKEVAGAVRPKQMPVRAEDAGNSIWGASNEEAHRMDAAAIFRVSLGVFGASQAVYERTHVQPTRPVHEMDAGRRSERQIAILRGGIVRGEKSREDRRQVHEDEQAEHQSEFAPGLWRTKALVRSLPCCIADPLAWAGVDPLVSRPSASRLPAISKCGAQLRQLPDGDRARRPPLSEADRDPASS